MSTPVPGTIPLLDHVVVATDDLEATLAELEAATGVRAAVGGVHPRFGTRNALVAFGGDAYLEIVTVDPASREDAGFVGPRPFDLDTLRGTRVSTWVVHPPSAEDAVAAAREAGFDPGDPGPGSRRTADGDLLTWRLTPPLADPSGLVPFVIDWGSTPSPATTVEPRLRLVALEGTHPEPDALRGILGALGTDLPLEPGPAALTLQLEGPAGRWRL